MKRLVGLMLGALLVAAPAWSQAGGKGQSHTFPPRPAPSPAPRVFEGCVGAEHFGVKPDGTYGVLFEVQVPSGPDAIRFTDHGILTNVSGGQSTMSREAFEHWRPIITSLELAAANHRRVKIAQADRDIQDVTVQWDKPC